MIGPSTWLVRPPVCVAGGLPQRSVIECENTTLPANPALQPAPAPHAMIWRRAPAPPAPLGRGKGPERPQPYPRPSIPSDQSAFVRRFGTARNLFANFIPNIESPAPPPPTMVRTFPGPSRTPSPPPPPASTPSPDIFLELYKHSRHPVDTRSHSQNSPELEQGGRKRGERRVCDMLRGQRAPANTVPELRDFKSMLHVRGRSLPID